MDIDIVGILVKWVHVSSACVLVGAVALILWGAAENLVSSDGASSDGLAQGLLHRFRTLVHSSLALLLLTGIYNFWAALQRPELHNSPPYQAFLGIKTLLFVVVFVLAIMLGRSFKGGTFPARSRALLVWMMILSLAIVLLSSFLNVERVHLLSATRPLSPSRISS